MRRAVPASAAVIEATARRPLTHVIDAHHHVLGSARPVTVEREDCDRGWPGHAPPITGADHIER